MIARGLLAELLQNLEAVHVRHIEIENDEIGTKRFYSAKRFARIRNALDVSKAKKVLGWTPQYVFEDGLRELVDWFKKEAR